MSWKSLYLRRRKIEFDNNGNSSRKIKSKFLKDFQIQWLVENISSMGGTTKTIYLPLIMQIEMRMPKGLSGWIWGKFRVDVSIFSVIYAIDTWIRVRSKGKIVRNKFHASKEVLKRKIKISKSLKPKHWCKSIFEVLEMPEETSKLHLRFLKSIHPDVRLRFFCSTPPMNLIQLLLHSSDPKLVARYF